jgi:transcription initiation factor TFIID subunit TAF12
MSVDPVSTSSVPLSSISQQSNSDVSSQREMSRVFEGAIKTAVTYPFNESNPTSRQNSLLLHNGANTYLRDEGMAGTDGQVRNGKKSVDDASMKYVAETMRSLYVEATNFTVAWSIAKRTGRDVETLLKAQ